MLRGQNEHFFFNDLHRESSSNKRVWDIVYGCADMQCVANRLLSNGFVLVETIAGIGSGNLLRFADDNQTMVAVYYLHGRLNGLTVSVTRHSFGSVDHLLKYWQSLKNPETDSNPNQN